MSTLITTRTLKRGLFAALVVILSLGLTAVSAQADTGTLEGTVTDLNTGLPLENALVVARADHGVPPGDGGGGGGHWGVRFAFTEADGSYAIDDLGAGDYRVFCGKIGYLRADADVTIVANQTTVQDFALAPRTYGSVSGTVTDAATGDPIAGAHVFLNRAWLRDTRSPAGESDGDGHWLHAMTGPDGSYLIENVPAGDYDARATASGYFPAEQGPVAVLDGETTVVDFALDPLAFGSVEGTVTDAVTGDAIGGAHVVLHPTGSGGTEGPGGGHWLHAMTGPDGTYLIENVPTGDYDARAMAIGYFPSDPVPVTVVEGTPTVVDFALNPLVFGSLEGTVTEADTGDPIQHAIVLLRIPRPDMSGPGESGGPGSGWHWAMTDENGFYRFEEVAVGTWRVRVFAWGYTPAEAQADVLEGQTTVVDFALDAWAGDRLRAIE